MQPITITKDVVQSTDDDFTVNNVVENTGIWLTFNKYSIRILQCDVGISIDVYPVNCEMDTLLKSIAVWDYDIPTEGDI